MNFNLIEKNGVSVLEFNGINVVAYGYTKVSDQHYFNDPLNAVAYFSIKNELYSVANKFGWYKTAEEFYEAMKLQLAIFKK